ncbi:peptidase M22 [Harryflintia acetispora]|uniref:peptidase M22 n=1 Tax=Harryflintia acetispora TaxID=1849041 RepID=UPI00189A0568
MALYFGIDTSNYTTSAALLSGTGALVQHKRLLPVREGQLGLRQSDAVFEHTRQLPEMIEACFGERRAPLTAVGASVRPRDAEGSYMPCFLCGSGAARILGAAFGVPVYSFSHQAGHVAAALYSSGRLDLMEKRFICFHFSGGTTDCLLVSPGEPLQITLAATSLDLKAGQAVDRVGKMLGLRFPAGPKLSELALRFGEPKALRPVFKGEDASLSGVENQCAALLQRGAPPEEVAAHCLSYILAVARRMAENARLRFGELPVVYAGGVMSSLFLRPVLEREGGAFAAPEFSSDNAAGIAVLTRFWHERKGIA